MEKQQSGSARHLAELEMLRDVRRRIRESAGEDISLSTRMIDSVLDEYNEAISRERDAD